MVDKKWLGLALSSHVSLMLVFSLMGLLSAGTLLSPWLLHKVWVWLPALLFGFSVNIGISLGAVLIGTLLGVLIGVGTASQSKALRWVLGVYVQVFRNIPWLVLIYFATYVIPFELHVLGRVYVIPDWLKVIVGLALPASANVSEIVRGALQSIPATQWESARSLAFRFPQLLRYIILPQCIARGLASWMNLYAMIVMGTALSSLVGVHDVLDVVQIASNSLASSSFTLMAYVLVLIFFFLYCYPIARYTRVLEQRYRHV